MDVVLLAGGRGTRIEHLWDAPKCLVPVAGKPVLAHLLRRVASLQPRCVSFALGHLAQDVMTWFFKEGAQLLPRSTLCYFAIEQPGGTAIALRTALPALVGPVLVLNGDTVPLYDLTKLLEFKWKLHDLTVAWCGQQAGQYVLGSKALAALRYSEESDFAAYITKLLATGEAAVYIVEPPGFLDVGTPEGFKAAQSWQA